jgi:hypothetical protein
LELDPSLLDADSSTNPDIVDFDTIDDDDYSGRVALFNNVPRPPPPADRSGKVTSNTKKQREAPPPLPVQVSPDKAARDIKKQQSVVEFERGGKVYDVDEDSDVCDTNMLSCDDMGMEALIDDMGVGEHKSFFLQFFSARDEGGGGGAKPTPHVEVETSLRPFDGCSQYSTSVAPETFAPEMYQQGRGGEEVQVGQFKDNLAPATSDRPRTRLVRKFGKMLRQDDREDSSVDVDIQEIHQVYSNEDEGNTRRPDPVPTTPIYTMQRKPTDLRRPLGLYKSPSSAGAPRSPPRSPRTRMKEALRNRNVVTPDNKHDGGRQASPNDIREKQLNEYKAWHASKDRQEAQSLMGKVSDDGSSSVAVYNNSLLCTGADDWANFVPDWWSSWWGSD